MNNAAAIGYMILAARRLGLDEESIRFLTDAMTAAMDEFTEYEAEREYDRT